MNSLYLCRVERKEITTRRASEEISRQEGTYDRSTGKYLIYISISSLDQMIFGHTHTVFWSALILPITFDTSDLQLCRCVPMGNHFWWHHHTWPCGLDQDPVIPYYLSCVKISNTSWSYLLVTNLTQKLLTPFWWYISTIHLLTKVRSALFFPSWLLGAVIHSGQLSHVEAYKGRHFQDDYF